jgi:hypothetical protein
LSVGVQVERDEGSQYSVTADFAPAVDANGDQISPQDRSLQVEGSLVMPVQASSRVWRYEWQEKRSTAALDSILVRIPRAGSSPAIDYAARIPVPGREDPFNIGLFAGQDLRLHVTPTPSPSTGLIRDHDTWQLDVRHVSEGEVPDTGRVLISAIGQFPREVRVPWEWIRATDRDSLVVTLQTFSSYRAETAPYQVAVFVRTVFTWHVRVLDSQTVPRLRGTVRGALLRDTLNAP